MSDKLLTMEVEGLEELLDELKTLTKKYPDKSAELLRKDARQFRKELVKNMRNDTESDGQSPVSLTKVGSYKVSPVYGMGINHYVEISAKSPHFHLVEHGHVLTDRKRNPIGFVQGKHTMETTTIQHQEKMPEVVEKMVDELLKESGLL